MPRYLISWAMNKVVLWNFERVITTYRDPDSDEPVWCDRRCATCGRTWLKGADESKAIGLVKLLSDEAPTTALVPEHTERFERRHDR